VRHMSDDVEIGLPRIPDGPYDSRTRAQLIYAFRRIFYPLVRILTRAGVEYYEFRDILRDVYTEVAVREGIQGYSGKPSVTSLASLLGIPPLEIERVLDGGSVSEPSQTESELFGSMLTTWSTDSTFHGPYGLPRQLALYDPPGRSFADLVRKLRPDADVEAILQKMLDGGVIQRAGPRNFKMAGRPMIFGPQMSGNLFEALGLTMEDLAATIIHNHGSAPDKKLFQRAVYSDQPLPVSKLEAYEKVIRQILTDAQEEIDDWLVKATKDGHQDEDTVSVGVNIFDYRRNEKKEPPLSTLLDRAPKSAPGQVVAWPRPSKRGRADSKVSGS
jgi:hypothetical protein